VSYEIQGYETFERPLLTLDVNEANAQGKANEGNAP
jgi:sarcosine oxidase subunit delta